MRSTKPKCWVQIPLRIEVDEGAGMGLYVPAPIRCFTCSSLDESDRLRSSGASALCVESETSDESRPAICSRFDPNRPTCVYRDSSVAAIPGSISDAISIARCSVSMPVVSRSMAALGSKSAGRSIAAYPSRCHSCMSFKPVNAR